LLEYKTLENFDRTLLPNRSSMPEYLQSLKLSNILTELRYLQFYGALFNSI